MCVCVCVRACVFVCVFVYVFVYGSSVHVSAKRVESLLDPLSERVREVKARQTSLGSARTQVKRLTSAIDTWRRHIEQGKPAVYPHDMRKFFGSEGSKYFRELMAHDSMRSTEHTPEHVAPSVQQGDLETGYGGWQLDSSVSQATRVVSDAERGLAKAWRTLAA